MHRLALLLALAAFLTPATTWAAEACCLCQRPNDDKKTCLTTTYSSRGETESDVCGRLVASTGLTDDEWTCDTKPVENCASAPTGSCPAGPINAVSLAKGETPTPANIGATDEAPKPAIIPKLNVPIPGFEFETPRGAENSLLAQYLSATYRYGISIAAVAATIMFVWGAFQYLVGSAITSIQNGKTIMQEAILGMILVFSAVMILRVVNPKTTELPSLDVTGILPYSDIEPLTAGTSAGVITNYTPPQAICRGESCSQYCNGCSAKTNLPSAPWIPDSNELIVIPNTEGLQSAPTKKLRTETVEALKKAGQFAAQAPGGPYTIRVADAYRPLSGQVYAACQQLCGRTQKKFAPPGASMHGTGLAVDVTLYKDGSPLVTVQDPLSNQEKSLKKENVDLLQRFMAQAGFVRYCPEVWHFEYGIAESAERKTQCPWPPPAPK